MMHRVTPTRSENFRCVNLPVISARYCTVEVFPVPVSPTNRTGSPLVTHTESCSKSTEDGRVAANVCLPLWGKYTSNMEALILFIYYFSI